MNTPFVLLAAAIIVPSTQAAQFPAPGKYDPHVRFVTYNKDDVTVIQVQKGTATRIKLAEDEKIVRDGSASGFAADCSRAELEWCIRADVGSSQVLVKPKDGATQNNLELRTDKRDYSFVFRVLPDARTGAARSPKDIAPMYRVTFRYPATGGTTESANPEETAAAKLASRLASARPRARNWKYAMQILPGASDIAPSLVFDDGRFTYFRFPANREIPTIFAVSPAGEEARVNFHMDDADNALAVVERLGRRFVLRLGTATIGIWNDAFDPDGVAPRHGTTVDGVARTLRQGDTP